MHRNTDFKSKGHRKWATKVNRGVSEIITGRRGFFMSDAAKLDLCTCMDLLDAQEPLPFNWNIELYTKPPPLNPRRAPTTKVGKLPGDKTFDYYEGIENDYDEDDLDSVARPEWNPGEVRILKQTAPPFWAMAR